MQRILGSSLILLLTASSSYAVRIGSFPGLEKLIDRTDAIVVLRIDRHVDPYVGPHLYSTHDCYIYQTLKGEIQPNEKIRLQLMDTRSSFVTPYALFSTHLMFLTKKRTPNEPTEYRTIEIQGANIRLSPFGHEKKPEGKTVADQIRSLINRSVEYWSEQRHKENVFLREMAGASGTERNNVQASATEEADSWSPPINGLQARIALVEQSEINGTRWLVPYLELRNVRDLAHPMEVRCDRRHVEFQLVDAAGNVVMNDRALSRTGSVPDLGSIILPVDSSIRISMECRNWGVPKAAAMISTDSGAWVLSESEKGQVFLQARIFGEKVEGDRYKIWHGKIETPMVKVDWKLR